MTIITEKWGRGRTEIQLFYGCVLVYSCCVIGPCTGMPEHCHRIFDRAKLLNSPFGLVYILGERGRLASAYLVV